MSAIWFSNLPQGWMSRRIKTISPVMRGASPRPIENPIYFDDEGEYAWVRISDVSSSAGNLRSSTQRLSSLGSSKSVKLQKGELFLSIAGSVGKPCITGIKACIHDGFVYFPFLPKESQKFIYWVFVSGSCFSGLGKLGTQLNLNTETVGNIAIPFPQLATQRRIADFLDRETARLDLLIEKKQRLVALLGEKYESAAADLSTGGFSISGNHFQSGIDWLGSIPNSWQIEKLIWHFRASKGTDAQKYTKEYCGGNIGIYPVYSGQTSNEGVMGLIDTFDYDFGERGVLFATTVGAKAMDLRHLKGKFSLSQNCMIIIPRRALPMKFFLYQMRVLFRKERQLIPDHMQASFRVEDLYRYRIALPPETEAEGLSLQIEKAEKAFKSASSAIITSTTRLKEYRSALVTAAVTGQIDVATYARTGGVDRRLDTIEQEAGA